MTPTELERLKKVMWPASATVDDLKRWSNQGFVWSNYSSRRFGLLQSQGGPCGVLAAIQAFLIKTLLFRGEGDARKGISKEMWTKIGADKLDNDARECALMESLTHIVRSCRSNESAQNMKLVTLTDESVPWTPASAPGSLRVLTFTTTKEYQEALLRCAKAYHGKSGVILFVFSVVLTRGIDEMRADMDEPMQLTATHGHCTQELLNLMLTGRATSQVFDGIKPVGETGLVLRGVEKRPIVGLLSYLEAMRYLEVGTLYKNPSAPIFVIGSTGHFTVLFCLDVELVAQSMEERVYKAIRRAFASFDTHDNGFIPVGDLDKFLDATTKMASSSENEDSRDEDPVASFVCALNTPTQRAKLRTACDPDSLGIILWKNFWTTCNQIVASSQTTTDAVTGATVVAPKIWEAQCRREFDRFDKDRNSFIPRDKLGELLMALPLPIQSVDISVATAQCDSDGLGIILWPNFWAYASRYPAYCDGGGSGGAGSSKIAVASVGTGRTFTMFHYNGLRRVIQGKDCGPSLVRFDLDVVPPGQIGGSLPPKASKIEQVLRTKFKGARIRWNGVEPPSIDG